MRSTSLVKAKARLSELVDRAEHRGQPTLILRRGKPAAAVVPIAMARAALARRHRQLSDVEIATMLDGLAASGDHSSSALADLYDSRNRLVGEEVP